MEYILAIDQGGSNTRAVVCDIHGNITGFCKTAGANHSVTGMDKAMQMLREASLGAIANAGIEKHQISLLYAGITGADFADEYELLQHAIQDQNICDNIIVKNDSFIALRGGTLKNFGVIVVAGSGCNCAVLSPSGEEFIYQYYVEDNIQGGGAISRKMIDAIYRAETWRIEKTLLTDMVLQRLGYPNVLTLLRADVEKKIAEHERLGIVPLVFEAALEGDWAATSIIKEIATGMAQLVIGGLNRFNITDIDIDVVISGSIFKGKGTLLIDTFSTEIHRCAARAKIINAVYEPVVGAALLGIAHIKGEISKEVTHNIEKSCIQYQLKR